MTNPTRARSGTRSTLIGVLAALSIIALVEVTTVIVQISNSNASSPPPTARPASSSSPAPAPPTVTETVTADPTVASTPEPPTVTTTVTHPSVPAPDTQVYALPPLPTSEQAPPPGASDAEIRTDANNAFGVVNTYWIELFNTWHDPQGRPVEWNVPDLMGGNGFYDSANGNPYSCDGTPEPGNAGFCEYRDASGRYLGTGDIAWDMELFRSENGDAPILAVVAHEVAHAAQARFWYDGEGLATPNPFSDDIADQIAYEQQADCLAGATLAKAEQDGYLTLEPGDLEEISTFFLGMESGGDHGDAVDRLAEFRWGYGGDIESCLYNQGVPPH